MKGVILFLFACVFYSQALECGFKKIKKTDIKDALSSCVKNNETLHSILEMTSSSTVSPSSESNEDGTTTSSRSDDKDRNGKSSGRIKRATKGQKSKSSKDDSEEDRTTEDGRNASEETSEKCIVQCLLKELDLLDSKGLPDRKKIVDGAMKNSGGRELQNFVQKTLDDCFEEIKKENKTDSCEFSNELISCLAEEGRSNCADWPAGSLPF